VFKDKITKNQDVKMENYQIGEKKSTITCWCGTGPPKRAKIESFENIKMANCPDQHDLFVCPNNNKHMIS
jgi:hypothetical protein